ncbi:MAG: amidohydrolase family protein [Spirochaetota bacterium]
MGSMKVIDFHTHIFPPELVKNRSRYLDDQQLFCIYDEARATIATLEDLLQVIEEDDLHGAVAMGFTWQFPRYAEMHNRYLAAAQEKSEKKVWAFGSIALETGSISSQVASIHEMGLHGVGEISFYREGMKGDNPLILRTVFAEAARYNLPVCVHVNEPVGHVYRGKYSPDIDILYDIVKDYTDVPIILSHWGGGLLFYELMPEVQAALSHVYYDTAASPYLYNEKIYRLAVDTCGPEKILFGTDFPLLTSSRYMDPIVRMIEDRSDRSMIVYNNALRLLESRW